MDKNITNILDKIEFDSNRNINLKLIFSNIASK